MTGVVHVDLPFVYSSKAILHGMYGCGDLDVFSILYLDLILLWMMYGAGNSYQSLGYLCRTYLYLLYMMVMDDQYA